MCLTPYFNSSLRPCNIIFIYPGTTLLDVFQLHQLFCRFVDNMMWLLWVLASLISLGFTPKYVILSPSAWGWRGWIKDTRTYTCSLYSRQCSIGFLSTTLYFCYSSDTHTVTFCTTGRRGAAAGLEKGTEQGSAEVIIQHWFHMCHYLLSHCFYTNHVGSCCATLHVNPNYIYIHVEKDCWPLSLVKSWDALNTQTLNRNDNIYHLS